MGGRPEKAHKTQADQAYWQVFKIALESIHRLPSKFFAEIITTEAISGGT